MSATLSPGTPWGPRRRAPQLGTALVNVLLGPVVVALLATMAYVVLSGSDSGFDFRHAYWSAGQRVLHGTSPYVWSPRQLRHGLAFVYPALSALLFAPLSLISRTSGAELFSLVTLTLAPATLWILRVRDWRIYGLVLAWLPVFAAWQTANETLFLTFGLACAWRWRDRPVVVGVLTAVLISLKPLMWPLAVWLLATRRWRACGAMAAAGAALNLVAWSLVGFDQIGPYLHAAAVDAGDSWRTGYGLPALAAQLGIGHGAALALMALVSVVLVAAVLWSGCARHNELRALTLTVALVLASSPLVWNHYFVLLVVPLALLRPRLGWLWAAPLLMWVSPPDVVVYGWQMLIVCLCAGVIFAVLVRQAAHAGGPRLEGGVPG